MTHGVTYGHAIWEDSENNLAALRATQRAWQRWIHTHSSSTRSSQQLMTNSIMHHISSSSTRSSHQANGDQTNYHFKLWGHIDRSHQVISHHFPDQVTSVLIRLLRVLIIRICYSVLVWLCSHFNIYLSILWWFTIMYPKQGDSTPW